MWGFEVKPKINNKMATQACKSQLKIHKITIMPNTIDNDHHSEQKTKTFNIIKYLSKNPFTSIYNSALIIGALFSYYFFASIKYIPDFELKDATTFIIGIALVGAGITFFMAAFFAIASWALHELAWKEYFLYNKKEDGSKEKITKDVEKKRSSTFITSSVLQSFAATCCLAAAIFYAGYKDTNHKLFSATIGISILLFVQLVQYLRYCKAKKIFRTQKGMDNPSIAFGEHPVLAQFVMLAIWGFIALLLFAIFSPLLKTYLNDGNTLGFITLGAFTFLVVSANSAFATLNSGEGIKKNPNLTRLLVGLFLVLPFLNFLPNNKISISKTAFRILGLGDIHNATFVVNNESCNAANILRKETCTHLPNEYGCIHPNSVLSRVGSEFILSFQIEDDSKSKKENDQPNEITIPLKKGDVISWSFTEEKSSSSCQ